jgi:predicted lipoprotein with Yx(FWY)xxD motif
MKLATAAGCFALALTFASGANAAEGLPAGIKVHQSDEGPVFTNDAGMTLYSLKIEEKAVGVSWCKDVAYTEGSHATQGYKHPLINYDHRPTCLQKNPLALVKEGAKAAGKWSIIAREDGIKQWAYEGHALYTSLMDKAPGQTNGISRGIPLYVPLDTPEGIRVIRESAISDKIHRDNEGVILTTTRPERAGAAQLTLYTYDLDSAKESKCDMQCAKTWEPLLAPTVANPIGEWSIVKRGDGALQWAFRGRPLYTNVDDFNPGDFNGKGVKNWRVAVVQPAPEPPREITTRVTFMGEVLTDQRGYPIYWYNCREDGPDALSCDEPPDRNLLWYDLCGGTPKACAEQWHPLVAPEHPKSAAYSWTVVTMPLPWSPVRAADGVTDGLKVWAYKGRPVFTYVGDDAPAVLNGWGIKLHHYAYWEPVGSTEGMTVE